MVVLLLARTWDALERVEGGGWEVRLRGGVGDVEVLRGRARGELVLAQEAVEIGPVVGERVVVEADHWDCCCCCAAATVVAVVERVFSLWWQTRPAGGAVAGVRPQYRYTTHGTVVGERVRWKDAVPAPLFRRRLINCRCRGLARYQVDGLQVAGLQRARSGRRRAEGERRRGGMRRWISAPAKVRGGGCRRDGGWGRGGGWFCSGRTTRWIRRTVSVPPRSGNRSTRRRVARSTSEPSGSRVPSPESSDPVQSRDERRVSVGSSRMGCPGCPGCPSSWSLGRRGNRPVFANCHRGSKRAPSPHRRGCKFAHVISGSRLRRARPVMSLAQRRAGPILARAGPCWAMLPQDSHAATSWPRTLLESDGRAAQTDPCCAASLGP